MIRIAVSTAIASLISAPAIALEPTWTCTQTQEVRITSTQNESETVSTNNKSRSYVIKNDIQPEIQSFTIGDIYVFSDTNYPIFECRATMMYDQITGDLHEEISCANKKGVFLMDGRSRHFSMMDVQFEIGEISGEYNISTTTSTGTCLKESNER